MDEENTESVIQITDTLRILNGDHCFTLQEAFTSEKLNTLQWRNRGYYSDILSCLYAIIRKMPIEQGDTLATYTERLEKLYEFLYMDSIGKIYSEAKKAI